MARSAALPSAIGSRLQAIAGNRLTQTGEILIFAQRFRTQARNRDDALARLCSLVAEAERAPKRRIATKPSVAARERRLQTKGKHGHRKRACHWASVAASGGVWERPRRATTPAPARDPRPARAYADWAGPA